jgi:hypothetical protein
VPTIGTPGNSAAWIPARWQPKKPKGLDCRTMASGDIQGLEVNFNGTDCPSLASQDIQKHGVPTEGTPGLLPWVRRRPRCSGDCSGGRVTPSPAQRGRAGEGASPSRAPARVARASTRAAILLPERLGCSPRPRLSGCCPGGVLILYRWYRGVSRRSGTAGGSIPRFLVLGSLGWQTRNVGRGGSAISRSLGL